ncbi:MAG TPA: hypothetical protein P5077_07675 [bacterium]|nr:hypothetical protein [bacterium]
MRYYLFLILLPVFWALVSCDSEPEKRYLKMPVESRVVPKTLTCLDGSSGYVALVTDNTDKGGRLKLLNGCTGMVDEEFSDGSEGDGGGLSVGAVTAGFDLMDRGDGIIVAIAVPVERVLMMKRILPGFVYAQSGEESISLAIMPRVVHAVAGFFLVYGDAGPDDGWVLVDEKGTVFPQSLTTRFSDIACNGLYCLALEPAGGVPYLIEVQLVADEPRLTASATQLPIAIRSLAPLSGMSSIDGDRFALWNETVLTVVGGETPQVQGSFGINADLRITAVAAVHYITDRPYHALSDAAFSQRRVIFEVEPDEDSLFEPTDSLVEMEDADAVQDATPDADQAGSSAGEKIYDPRDADAIWLATATGRVLSFDLTAGGWMYDPPEEGESILPLLSYAGATIPEDGDSSAENMPQITRIAAIRGLPFTVSYDMTYEALYEASSSAGGVWDPEQGRLSDERASFGRIVTGDPTGYAVLLTGPRSGGECLIPPQEAVTLTVRELVDDHVLKVDAGKWEEDIASCYDGAIAYGIFPKDRYLVRLIGPYGTIVERSAREMPADWDPVLSREVSYRDEFLDIVVKRRTDKVRTARGLSFSFTVSPAISFFGPRSDESIKGMAALPNGHMLLFAPLTASMFEYSPVFEETIVTYR